MKVSAVQLKKIKLIDVRMLHRFNKLYEIKLHNTKPS